MKKLFVSVPMKGRTEEQIRYSIDRMKAIAEATFNQELELIPSYFPDQDHKGEPIACLGRALKMMSDADYHIAPKYQYGNGCYIEELTFETYKNRDNQAFVEVRAILTPEEVAEMDARVAREAPSECNCIPG